LLVVEEIPMSNQNEKQGTEQELRGTEQVILIGEITPKQALKQLRNIVGEYEDYVTVPNRRKSDHHFRTFVISYLNQNNDLIKEIHAQLIEKQQMSVWAVANSLINEISTFSREIERIDYGFTTFFENPKLRELDISQIYLIEYDFIITMNEMRERINSFMNIIKRNYLEDLDLWFETIDRLIGRLIKLDDDRTKLISSYERLS
jgi:hypothetical protein